MRRTKIFLSLVFIVGIFVSCGSPWTLRDIADIKYHYGSTGLSSKIRLDGIYVNKWGYQDSNDSCYNVAIFYDDGTFARFFINDDKFDFESFDLSKIAKKMEGYSVRKRDWKRAFGCYKLEGDFLECNWFYPLVPFAPNMFHWEMAKYFWHIVDSNTIELYGEKIGFQGRDSIYIKEMMQDVKDNFSLAKQYPVYDFVPYKDLPSSYSRHRKESWIWESEEEQKLYFNDRGEKVGYFY